MKRARVVQGRLYGANALSFLEFRYAQISDRLTAAQKKIWRDAIFEYSGKKNVLVGLSPNAFVKKCLDELPLFSATEGYPLDWPKKILAIVETPRKRGRPRKEDRHEIKGKGGWESLRDAEDAWASPGKPSPR